jgi:hypothetical protein
VASDIKLVDVEKKLSKIKISVRETKKTKLKLKRETDFVN